MKQIQILLIISSITLLCCSSKQKDNLNSSIDQYITILGTAQDAGYPQINCSKTCCSLFYKKKENKKLVSCLGLIDNIEEKKYLFDATPDIVAQTQLLRENHLDNGRVIDGVFLTHAHIGHYTGLMHFGREAMSGNQIPIYAMPKMKAYLEQNGPWSQLIHLKN